MVWKGFHEMVKMEGWSLHIPKAKEVYKSLWTIIVTKNNIGKKRMVSR